MKKKNKVLLTSMATIAMCASLVAGGTYALFTSESAVNVAVTSGTVSVVATLDDKIELGSTLGENVAETTVEYSTESNTIALSNMLPGDYIEFDINVHNASTVSVKYQTVISVVEDDGLFDGLEVSIDNEEIKGKDAKMSKWETLAVGSDDIIVPVRVELPDDRGNDFQGKTCTIAYTVNAVQGNAATLDPAPEAVLTEFTDEEKKIDLSKIAGFGLSGTAELSVGMNFAPTETEEEIADSQYAKWATDYVISFDKDITYVYDANDNLTRADLALLGQYNEYSDMWIPLPLMFPDETSATEFGWTRTVDETTGDVTCVLPADAEVRLIRLLGASGMVTAPDPNAAYALTYDLMPMVGNFNCGIITDLSALGLAYTTPASTGVHLELNLYEFTDNGDGTYTELRTVNCVTYDTVLSRKAANQTELNGLLASGESVELGAGSYDMPGVTGKEFAISGTEDTVVKIFKPALSGSDVTFNGVTVQGSGYSTGVQHVNTVTYNDVTIKGEMCLYGEKVVFNNCTFELAAGQYLWTYAAEEVEFNNCTFNTNGKAILMYKEGDINQTVTVRDCTFNATTSGYAGTITNQACAAIELHNYKGIGLTLNLEGTNTVDEDFSGLWRIKEDVQESPAITVNGVTYREDGASVFLDGVAYTLSGKEVTKK
ncbi:MAG: hypothetical protein IJA89_04115 [Clostridia bacterium]|nr:hypothetical protein [Clostridia bacterium]